MTMYLLLSYIIFELMLAEMIIQGFYYVEIICENNEYPCSIYILEYITSILTEDDRIPEILYQRYDIS